MIGLSSLLIKLLPVLSEGVKSQVKGDKSGYAEKQDISPRSFKKLECLRVESIISDFLVLTLF